MRMRNWWIVSLILGRFSYQIFCCDSYSPNAVIEELYGILGCVDR